LDIGWILLRRPGGLSVIHLLIVFWPKRGWRDEGVPDELISVIKSVISLIEIDDWFFRLPKEMRITEIPVSWDEGDLFDRSGFYHSFKKRKEEFVDKGFLVWDHIFISFG
jgi:hypothetical protein